MRPVAKPGQKDAQSIKLQVGPQMVTMGLTFSRVVWLLGLLNCSNCTKNIHEFKTKTIDFISLLLQEMKDILRASLRMKKSA
eukprot:1152933-Pelagomonas_calceolata.AAC.1